MTDRNRISAAALAVFGTPVKSLIPLHGGDLSEVFLVRLQDGAEMVAKAGRMVPVESRMLEAISAAGAPAPRVLGCEDGVLFLQALAETPPTPAGWRALGTGLRRLHDTDAATFGWPEDYAFGSVPILNTRSADWIGFWVENRLLAAPDHLPPEIRRRLEHLAMRLPEHMPAAPAPALLHGDLWRGNVLFTGAGAHLIDPACYFGHNEVDLAMLELFGAPPAAFYEGYGACDKGYADRRPIYQLWPALVHLRLFGAGYRAMVETRLDALRV